ncbi:MAG: ABC transporter substrate-binding protein [Candidatus Bathyarchaeia archaeon]
MRRVILVAAIVAVVVAASVYGGYNILSQSPSTSPTPTPSQSPIQSPTSASPTPSQTPSSTATPTPSPSPTIEPNATQSPEAPQISNITVVDANGANVTVAVPVKRIICLTMIEIVHVLGAGDKVVARSASLSSDAEAILPKSILELPDVGTDMEPNLELIVELKPDLVLASQRLTDENRKKLEDAGIAVMEDTLTGSRRYECIRNLALILQAEQKATEFINYETYYVNLVKNRVAALSRSEKPLVYFEWYKLWFSTGPGGSYDKLIVDAGGINIAENASTSSPQLSAEFVAEANPAIVIRMSTYLDGEDLASLQTLRNSILARPELSETKAVKNGTVYVIKSVLLVDRDVIGLLYFAKWLHPNLFQDIDPAAIHAEYIQRFFNAELTGVFTYP